MKDRIAMVIFFGGIFAGLAFLAEYKSHYAHVEHYCSGPPTAEHIAFVLACAPEKTNGSGAVAACRNTAFKLFCPRTVTWGVQGDSTHWHCSEAKAENAKKACRNMGYRPKMEESSDGKR